MDLTSLSAKEKRIIKEAMRCGEQKLTVRTLAQNAKVKPEFIVAKLKSPEFRQLFIEAMRDGIVAETPAILHSFVNAAKEGSFQHGKLMLELAGVHQEKQCIDLNARVEVDHTMFKTDADRKEFLKATLTDIVEE